MSAKESATPETPGVAHVELMARLDLSTANELADKLREIEGNIIVDASKVKHIGALGLQVLISAARTAQSNGHDFQIENLGEKPSKQLLSFGIRPEALAEKAGPLTQGEEEFEEANAT